MSPSLLMALLLAVMPVTMPFDYDTATNIAIVGVPAEYLAGTDMAIAELGHIALPITSHGICVRFADEFGNLSPVFDVSMSLAAVAGDVFHNPEDNQETDR